MSETIPGHSPEQRMIGVPTKTPTMRPYTGEYRPWLGRLLWQDFKRSWFTNVTMRYMRNPIVYTPSQQADQPALTIGTIKNRERPIKRAEPLPTVEELRAIDAKYGRPHTLFPTAS